MNDAYRTPQSPPIIAPLPAGINRPIWSVMIPVYNCMAYLEANLKSVLNQDLGEDIMQIEVIDDGSTDGDIEAFVNKIGNGRVSYFRQNENVGSLRNFETCIQRSKGHYIHLFHGDDVVIKGFYEEIKTLFDEYPEIGAAFTDYQYMDDNGDKMWDNEKLIEPRGIVENFLHKIGSNQLLQTCAIVVKRDTYETLGGFYGVHYGEDWEMWARIAAHYSVAYSPKVLAKYRVHQENISFNSLTSGQNIHDISKVIKTIEQYLPKKEAKKITKNARKNFSQHYARIAHQVYHHSYNTVGALAQTHGALKLDINKVSVTQALKMYTKLLIRYRN